MWIKEPPELLIKSHCENLNFLAKFDNIYVMDNHLAAAWCWLDHLDVKERYNFFHIDAHYDLLDFPETMKKEIIEKKITLENLTLHEYLSLRQPLRNNEDCAMFRWDNYIGNINSVYPNFFKSRYFATQKVGTILKSFVESECEFYHLVQNLECIKDDEDNSHWIINLDIDYFFSHSGIGEKIIQTFSDEFIISLSRAIKQSLDKEDVLTICLSPECCGGWGPSIDVAKLVCKELEIELDFTKLKFN